MSDQHITIELINNLKFKCNLTFVYAQNFANLRTRLWKNLREDAINIYRPWLIFGDFNCIRSPSERKGGNPVSFGNLFELDDMSNYTGLKEIDIKGYEFSWWSGPSRNIFSKIDRVFANLEWINLFSDLTAIHLPSSVCDHNAVMVSLFLKPRDKNRPFRFMNHWPLCDQYLPLIEEKWISKQEDQPLYQLINILKNIKRELKIWSAKIRNTKQEVKVQRENCSRLQKLLETSNDHNLIMEFQNAKIKLEMALKKEFLDTKQKANCDWLRMGDEASSFFYAKMSSRRSRKCLTNIVVDGKAESEDTFVDSAINFYKQMFNLPLADKFP